MTSIQPSRRWPGALTPVPGGVGPLTIAMLLKNTLAAAEGRRGYRRREMLKVALTGGIATGKSHVLEVFRRHGVPCLDADELAHGVMAAGTEAVAGDCRTLRPGRASG